MVQFTVIRRIGIFVSMVAIAGCVLWLEFGCLAPQRGFESSQCNTTSARILQSLYREDFFATFQDINTGQSYPEQFMGQCKFNEKEFAGCDVHFRSICVIGQVWDCLRKGNDPPRADYPNVKDNCIGSILFGSLIVCGFAWLFMLECQSWKCCRQVPYENVQD